MNLKDKPYAYKYGYLVGIAKFLLNYSQTTSDGTKAHIKSALKDLGEIETIDNELTNK